MRLVVVAFLVGAQVAMGQYFRGVNLSGAEFGATVFPGIEGTNYTFHSENTFRYFGQRKLALFRVSMRWERLQPVLGGPLATEYLSGLKRNIQWAKRNGVVVAPQIHNFGRYVIAGDPDCPPVNANAVHNQGCAIGREYNGTVKVTIAHFQDFWRRMSDEFRDEPTVYAYDLMNEPQQMSATDSGAAWRAISQAAVDAIRANGDTKLIMVPGDSFSNATGWATYNGQQSWINDPANNFMYEAHLYFDRDFSGGYQRTYDQELALNPNLATIGRDRIAPFVQWCQRNGVRGYVGEYGVPDNDSRWLTILDDLLAQLDAAGMPGSYWAVGEWWGNYALAVQPTNNFQTDRPQLPTLLAHLGAVPMVSVSAPNGYLAAAAPDSLSAGYGAALVPEGSSAGDVQVELSGSDWSQLATVTYASPGQINYYIPPAAPLGWANVTVRQGGRVTAMGTVNLRNVAPGLYGFAQLIRYRADGTESWESAMGQIDLGPETDRVYLVIYASGLRRGERPSMQLGDTNPTVEYWKAQGTFAGVDQVNVLIPRSLAGKGNVTAAVTSDGVTSNGITLNFR